MNYCVCAVDGIFLRGRLPCACFISLYCEVVSSYHFYCACIFIFHDASFIFTFCCSTFALTKVYLYERDNHVLQNWVVRLYRHHEIGMGALEYSYSQAGVMQNMHLFSFFTCRHPGSTNDAWVITESEGGGILMGDSLPTEARSTARLPTPYYGVGDDASVNCTTLLSPYGGTHLDM
jgi:hypothetical protein